MLMQKSKLRAIKPTIAIIAIAFGILTLSNASTSEQNNSKFHPLVLQTIGEYKSYSIVDEYPHEAPIRCAIPQTFEPRISKSNTNIAHGKKVYWLYAKRIDDYFANTEAPAGQTLVKESFEPGQDYKAIMRAYTKSEESSSSHVITSMSDDRPDPGKRYGLFIMTKLDPKTPGTDQGWVYATVGPDYKTITSAGRVQSCMACHTATKNDRQFGPNYEP